MIVWVGALIQAGPKRSDTWEVAMSSKRRRKKKARRKHAANHGKRPQS
ncbi:50S ribosomal protein bL37 [Streptomyces sp. NPDC056121]|nr:MULTISPECIES: hypothetical protein [Streptomyces]MCX5079657.1 hypothetical protein [Streptomyces sp. NBC_00401]UDL97945.1 hypothetical protein LGI35_06610 [Streptomyces longhuiensis]